MEAAAARCGWTVVGTYEDAGISGAKGRDKRPEFDRLCRDAARRKIDVVMAWSVDRLGRSLQHLVQFLADLHASGVDLYLHQQGIDTTTPSGKAMFQMLGVFAEFERAMIRERVRSGLARARGQGKRLGRPSTPAEVVAAVQADLQAGDMGIRRIAAKHGVEVSVVQKVRAGNR